MRPTSRLCLAITSLFLALVPVAGHAADIVVFAAASLNDALTEIGKDYQSRSGHHVTFSFAASSVLARQIESSGGADIFVSADRDWMDYLDSRRLVDHATRKDLLGNHLVLIEPVSSRLAIKIAPGFDLAGALSGGRLAVADPDSVPAGKYAKAALTNLHVWASISGHLAPAENVRAALALVARAEAPLGIVYTTDALAEPRVRIAGTFPDDTHPPIVYPIALTKDAKPPAAAFLQYLCEKEAMAVFLKDGFEVLTATR